MAETKTPQSDKLGDIINGLYKNSNNKRNEKNALKGKATLKDKILSKEHALVTLGLYQKLTKAEKECVNGKNSSEDIKYGILKKIHDIITSIEKGEDVKDVYVNYTRTGKDILEEYLSGNNNRGKSDSKQKKVLSFSKLFLNQERQKCG
jgi:hypothetical protein